MGFGEYGQIFPSESTGKGGWYMSSDGDDAQLRRAARAKSAH